MTQALGTKWPQVTNRLMRLPGLGKTDSVKGNLPAITLVLGPATWVLWEYDHEDRMGFGLCDMGMGFPELGYVSIDEVEQTAEQLGKIVWCAWAIDNRFDGYKYLSLEVPSFLVS